MSRAIPPTVVQAVRDAIDIVALVGEHTTLQKRGRRWVGLCPFHQEKSPSFGVDGDAGLFHCFGCGAGGDGIGFQMQITGEEFGDAIEALAQRYGIPWSADTTGNRAPIADALAAAERHFRAQLARNNDARAYLEKRGIPAATIERFRLGAAATGWRALLDDLGRSVGVDELARAGLVARSDKDGRPYDRFRNRLVFPIRSESGRLVGFGGRALGDDPAKYINTPETEAFRKSKVLFGLDLAKRAIRERGYAIVVEGYFDVVACCLAGHDEVVASMGTSLTAEQAALLARYTDTVIVGYDGDNAGETAHRRALGILLGAGLSVRRLELPDGHDPDSWRQAKGPEALAERIGAARDAIEREIDRLCPPGIRRGPAEAATTAGELAVVLAAVSDPIARHGWARTAAERLAVPIDLLLDRAKALSRATRTGPPSTPAIATPTRRREPGLEHRLVEHLLATLPRHGNDGERLAFEPATVPPDAAFEDDACRAIFSAWRQVASADPHAGRDALVAAVADNAVALDEVARVLLGEPTSLPGSEVASTLGALRDRYLRQRRNELQRELDAAARLGDNGRQEQLLTAIDTLRREIHHRTTPVGRVS
jgi:DNA primase